MISLIQIQFGMVVFTLMISHIMLEIGKEQSR